MERGEHLRDVGVVTFLAVAVLFDHDARNRWSAAEMASAVDEDALAGDESCALGG